MSDMKCPFCQQELHHYEPLGLYMCKNCFVDCRLGQQDFGTKGLWQELIRTRKALDVAVDTLKRIDETRSGVKENLHATNGRTLNAGNGFCWTTIDDIHNALEQITALKQKDK